MKNIKFCIIAILLISSCAPESSKTSSTPPSDNSVSAQDLIGKTIEYKYGESIYHVTIDSETEMHWEAMAGDEKGVKEEETYKIESINSSQLFITWGEENGIGVSQVLDFENKTVYNHLIRGRDISIGRGEIRILP